MRTYQFIVVTDVSPEVVEHPEIMGLVQDDLEDLSRQPQKGPRGGRYERLGNIEFEDFPREDYYLTGRRLHRCVGRFTGKYVRPKRARP